MNLTELYRRLSLGELSNLSIGNEGGGSITDRGKPKIVLHANTTLKKLYARFNILEKQLVLETRPHRTEYHLHPQHAFTQISDSNPHECFIIDNDERPFTGDLVRPVEAFDNSGQRYVLNEDGSYFSLYYTKPEVLTIPDPLLGQVFAVSYQALHPELLDGDDEQEISIPSVLETALTAGIAGEIYKNMNTQEASMNASLHYATYEDICGRVEQNDLLARTRSNTGFKFEQNGWI